MKQLTNKPSYQLLNKKQEKLPVNLLYLTTSETKGTYLASLKIRMPGTHTV
jgi:hypothetical protein